MNKNKNTKQSLPSKSMNNCDKVKPKVIETCVKIVMLDVGENVDCANSFDLNHQLLKFT